MSSHDYLQVSDDGGVRILTLNRPEKKNAISPELAAELSRTLDETAADETVRVAVIHGAGDSFCAGADLGVFLAIGRGEMEGPKKVGNLHRHLRAFPKPLIAAAHGQAVGMGVTLLPHFDMVYAAEGASFLTPFVRLGLVLEFGSSFTLARLIGRQRANELIMGARPLDAATAEHWGLVNRVFPAAEMMRRVREIAAGLAELPPGAVAACKRLIRQGEESSMEDAISREDEVLSGLYGGPENLRAVEAFLESRRQRVP
ncbi:MAG: enoyl-CoA hydratase [bacterium]|nr:enoyl-CoA hydratase [bacterium]